jgi:hypothetical protein
VPCPLQSRELTLEEQRQVAQRETRRAIFEDVVTFCEDSLWDKSGNGALEYLRGQDRGLADEEIREFQVGLYPALKPLKAYLLERGHSAEEIDGVGALWGKLVGYIVVPWYDEHGRFLTLYGRWPNKATFPLMREKGGWQKEWQMKQGEWVKRNDGTPWE